MRHESVRELGQDIHDPWSPYVHLLCHVPLLPAVRDHGLHEAFLEGDQDAVKEGPFDLVVVRVPLGRDVSPGIPAIVQFAARSYSRPALGSLEYASYGRSSS